MKAAVGIIGCGQWGQHYVRIFSELGTGPIPVYDQDPERLDTIRRRYPQLVAFTNPQDLLDQEIEAVIVATPASTHFEIAQSVLLAGKDVLVEKPLVLDVEEGRTLTQIAERAGRILMVGHVFLYNPGIRRLKEYVHAGPSGIGRVYFLYATRTNLGPIRRDVNVVWDLATHDISIFNDLLDAHPLWVNAVGGRVLGTDRDDVAFITLTYPGGILAHLHVGWADPNRVRQVVVVGSSKRIVFDDVNVPERLKVFEKGVAVSGTDADNFGEFMLAIRDGDTFSPRLEPLEPLKEMCSHFLDCVANRTRPRTDGDQGLAVVAVLTAIEQSMEVGGARVSVPTFERIPA